jgi:hypothetical protein
MQEFGFTKIQAFQNKYRSGDPLPKKYSRSRKPKVLKNGKLVVISSATIKKPKKDTPLPQLEMDG